MEMAGIVTYTGALLIKQARELVEQVRRRRGGASFREDLRRDRIAMLLWFVPVYGARAAVLYMHTLEHRIDILSYGRLCHRAAIIKRGVSRFREDVSSILFSRVRSVKALLDASTPWRLTCVQLRACSCDVISL